MTIPPKKRLRKAGGSLFWITLTCGPLSLSSSTVRRADAPFSLTVHSSPVRDGGREGGRGREGEKVAFKCDIQRVYTKDKNVSEQHYGV